MLISGYKVSDRLEMLYNDVQNLKPDCKITIEIVDKVPDEDNNVDGMQQTLKNGDIMIYSKKSDNIECIISHELLHAYFLRKNYPNHHYVYGDNNAIYNFGRDLYNHVIHKLILEEQLRRGFDVSLHQKYLAENLGVGIEKEWKDPKIIIQFSMTILLCDILCGDYKKLYEENINIKFPKANTIAKKLYSSMMKSDYKTQLETRDALVRVINRFDQIIKGNKLPHLNLSENVTITHLPTEEELKLNVLKVFSICKQCKFHDGITFWSLIYKLDNQSSYIIATRGRKYDEIRDLLRDLSVKDLYEDSNCILNIN